jgi:hypothetical protein
VQLGRLDERRRETAVRELLLSPALRLAEVRASVNVNVDVDVNANTAAAVSDSLPTWRLEVRTTVPLPAGGGTVFIPTEIAALSELHAGAAGAAEGADPRQRPDRLESWRLALPDGWRLVSPDSFTFAGPGLRWSRTVRQMDGTLILRREIDWDETALTPAQNDAFLQTMSDAVARERTPLLLKGETP